MPRFSSILVSCAGIEVSDETLALDAIRDVGPAATTWRTATPRSTCTRCGSRPSSTAGRMASWEAKRDGARDWAREKAQTILATTGRGPRAGAERALAGIIEHAERPGRARSGRRRRPGRRPRTAAPAGTAEGPISPAEAAGVRRRRCGSSTTPSSIGSSARRSRFSRPRRQGAERGGTALLAEAGATVDNERRWRASRSDGARRARDRAARVLPVRPRRARPAVRYGGDDVHFDPGSSRRAMSSIRKRAPTARARPTTSCACSRWPRCCRSSTPSSTALVCSDVPAAIADLYRLYLVLMHSRKPIVTGAFGRRDSGMIECWRSTPVVAGAGRPRPRAVFDVCPSPPLIWSAFGTGSLIRLARAGVPAQMVSMPLAGATAPATLAGSVVQHAAECLSGITIHQPRSPVRRSCGAARRRSSTCATAPRRWARWRRR